MHAVQTTEIGWYRNKHHSDTIDTKKNQTQLKNTIEKHFTSKKESIIKWADNTNGLQAWNREYYWELTVKRQALARRETE